MAGRDHKFPERVRDLDTLGEGLAWSDIQFKIEQSEIVSGLVFENVLADHGEENLESPSVAEKSLLLLGFLVVEEFDRFEGTKGEEMLETE